MNLSIIIPAYNEERRIGKTLEEYCSYFRTKKKELGGFEIVVVLNACKDNTLKIVKEKQAKFKEIRFLNFEKGGKGFAITRGFQDALKRNNELIGFVDADMATPPEAYYDLVKNIGNYEGIIASRWLRESDIIQEQTFFRRVMSRTFNFLVRAMFSMSYNDTQCGAKLFKRKVIEKIASKIYLTQWAFDVNLLYLCKINSFKVKEQPTKWRDQTLSKIDILKAPMKMFTGILRLRILYSPFRKAINIYDALPARVKIKNYQ